MRQRLPLLVALFGVAVALTALGVSWSDTDSRPPGAAATVSLEQAKLREEVRKLEIENRKESGLRGLLSSYAPFLTALVAAGGLGATVWKQVQEQARQRQADRDERAKQRQLEELESRRRLDARFTAILSELGAPSEAVQAGAAVSLLSFLRPEQGEYHRQVRLVALANLKVPHSDAVRKLLVRVFEAAVRTGEELDPIEIDLSHADLRRADLSELDLSDADLGWANLRGANLTDTLLRRARGYEVNLEEARPCGEKADLTAARFEKAHAAGAVFRQARLVSAHFREAELSMAQFQNAKLQAAHLEGADLRGARFEQADLSDTYFFNDGLAASLDEAALRSISRAYNWEKAHFAPEHEERLRTIAQA